jgi:hypothetical protein
MCFSVFLCFVKLACLGLIVAWHSLQKASSLLSEAFVSQDKFTFPSFVVLSPAIVGSLPF